MHLPAFAFENALSDFAQISSDHTRELWIQGT
jgi:hypothetical protein